MVLYILAAVLLLILGVLLASVGVRVKYGEDDGLSVILRIRLFGIPVYRRQLLPEMEKRERIRLRDYSPAALEKKKRREERRRAREKAKAERKKNKEKKTEGETEKKPKKTRKFSDKVRLVKMIARISLALVKKFGAMTKIKVNTLHITVGGEDAASAAISYGLISQGIAYLCEILSHFTPLKTKSDDSIDVNVDFLSEETTAEADIVFSTVLCRILGLLISAGVMYIKG